MRLLLILLIGFIAACNETGGNSGSTAVPSTPTTPAFVWPPADAVKTSDFSGYSCSILQDTSVACYDGSSVTELPSSSQTADILVGDGIICTLSDSNGAPEACTSLDDPTCTHPPTEAHAVCWTPSDPTPITMKVAESFGFHAADYENGALSLYLDSGYMCVTESSFDKTTYAWVADTYKCGNVIAEDGVLL